jgi:hypothetical protein
VFTQAGSWSGAASYQGMTSAMPKDVTSKYGFSRWFGPAAAKARIDLGAQLRHDSSCALILDTRHALAIPLRLTERYGVQKPRFRLGS